MYEYNVTSAGLGEAVRPSALGQRWRQPRTRPAARHLHPTGIYESGVGGQITLRTFLLNRRPKRCMCAKTVMRPEKGRF